MDNVASISWAALISGTVTGWVVADSGFAVSDGVLSVNIA